MSRLYKEEEVVQAIVDILEQAEENTGEIIVDRPMGWASIRDYAEEVVDLMPTAPGNVVAQIVIDTDELIEKIKEEYNIVDAWIPCEEKLPEKDTVVLVWMSSDERCICGEFRKIEFGKITDERYDRADAGWVWLNESGADYWAYANMDEIVAWMPLPGPYKEGKVNE